MPVLTNSNLHDSSFLQHDSTPRSQNSPFTFSPHRAVSPNFRYRGYPIGRFEQARDQQQPTIDHTALTRSDEAYHGKAHYFDTRNPKIFDEPNKGLLYGSLNLPDNLQRPKPTNNLFQDKTSADLRKFRKHQSDVDRDIANFKSEKHVKMVVNEEQKRTDMSMLKQYHPWGRPGGGAPNNCDSDAHRKQKFTEMELALARCQHAEDTPLGDNTHPDDDFLTSFGRPGGGAPLRTNSGRVAAEVKADVNLRFQGREDARHACDRDFRYKRSDEEKMKYSKDLDKQINLKHLEAREEKLLNLHRELDMLKQQQQQQSPRSVEATQNLKEDIPYLSDPWGRGGGHPIRDERGEVKRYKFSNKAGVVNFDDPNYQPPSDEGVSLQFGGHGGGGAPLKTNSGHVMSRLPISLQRNQNGEVILHEEMNVTNSGDPAAATYDPWGRGGGGAPLRGEGGEVIANIYGKMTKVQRTSAENQHTKDSKKYLSELRQGIEQQDANRREMKHYEKQETGNILQMMQSSHQQQPRRDPITQQLTNQHRATSDVTKQKMNIRSQRADESSLYHTQLEQAAQDRSRSLKLEQLKQLQLDRQHESTMSNFWGRPGAGAPNSETNKLGNINDSIYTPRGQHHDTYAKRYDDDAVAPPVGYVRTTINSLHSNQYEYTRPNEGTHQNEGSLVQPWATLSKKEAT